MTRILITGCRHWRPERLAERIAKSLRSKYGFHPIYGSHVVVVHGGAPGIDCTIDEACRIEGVKTEPHFAKWDELDHPKAVIRYDRNGRPYNANAGPIRNQEMVDLGAEFAIAMHRNLQGSKGTKDCVRRCLAAGIPVWLVESEDAEPPKRLTKV